MAVGKELEPTQRGIAFSTISALEVSVLILIVGAGTAEETTGGFSIQALANLIETLIGRVGVYVFAIGFIAAALSSMLAVPLGAAITAESVFSQTRCELDEEDIVEDDLATELENKLLNHKNIEEVSARETLPTLLEEGEVNNERETNQKIDAEQGLEEEDEVPPMASPEHLTLLPSPYTSLIPGSLPAMRLQQAALQIAAQVARKEGKELKKLPRTAYWGIITGMVLVSTLIIALDGQYRRYTSTYHYHFCFSSKSQNYPHCSSVQRLPATVLRHMSSALSQRPPVHVLFSPEGLGQHLPCHICQPHSLPCQQRFYPEANWPPPCGASCQDGDRRRCVRLLHDSALCDDHTWEGTPVSPPAALATPRTAQTNFGTARRLGNCNTEKKRQEFDETTHTYSKM